MDDLKSSKDGTVKTTIFSTNPETGFPYMTLQQAKSLARTHIYKTSRNLLNLPHLTMDDLVQELMVKMLAHAYDPKKAAAKTFFILCATSHLGHVFKRNVSAGDRFRCRSDFAMQDIDDGSTVMATEFLGVENVTPYDYLEAKEQVREHFKTTKTDGSIRKGFNGFKDKKNKKKKRKL